MRILRKSRLCLGLIVLASLSPLCVRAEETSPALTGFPPAAEPANPSFHDIAAPPAPAKAPPAPLAIPLVDAAPVAVILESDALRIAVKNLLADDAVMGELGLKAQEREALAAFYAQAEQPLAWSKDGAWTPAAQAAAARLAAAAEDGLNPDDYPHPDFAPHRNAAPSLRARADLALSAAVFRYARDARGGRIDLARLSPLVTPKLDLPEIREVLSRVSAAGREAGAVLASYNPPHAGYAALKERLAELRSSYPAQPSVQVPKGPSLKIGMRDPRVPLIRARFNLTDVKDQTVYDARLASAVAAFQKEKGLPTNGVLTDRTAEALSAPSLEQRETALIVNMERWRWLPRDLGARHIMVNVPEFRLRLVEEGKVIHQARVIVGKKRTQTPIFSENMKYLVVNPTWTVPPSIVKKEILPALAKDPSYAARKGYRITRSGNRIKVQQPPGSSNALGRVKFMFPNAHAVYLHDTPSKKLFSASERAFSHGCVRVDKPFELAGKIMEAEGSWTEKKLRGLIGNKERYLNLSRPLPVHLTYFTLAVDKKGELQTFGDLYGLDGKVRAALKHRT